MLSSQEAVRLIQAITRLAGGAVRRKEEENATMLEVSLPSEATPQRIKPIVDIPARYRVLHVEDTGRVADLVYYYLRTRYDVVSVQTPAEALERAAQEEFDYILTDLHFGDGMDGYQLTELLRGIERYASAPIIALSAYSSRRDVERCIEAGCSAFLSKPFLKEDLMRLLTQLEGKLRNGKEKRDQADHVTREPR